RSRMSPFPYPTLFRSGLAEQGMRPSSIFDTELAARLLGLPKVGLAAVVADVLGLGLAKEHSAVDWSTRPLPEAWLRYAALDVERSEEQRLNSSHVKIS